MPTLSCPPHEWRVAGVVTAAVQASVLICEEKLGKYSVHRDHVRHGRVVEETEDFRRTFDTDEKASSVYKPGDPKRSREDRQRVRRNALH